MQFKSLPHNVFYGISTKKTKQIMFFFCEDKPILFHKYFLLDNRYLTYSYRAFIAKINSLSKIIDLISNHEKACTIAYHGKNLYNILNLTQRNNSEYQ